MLSSTIYVLSIVLFVFIFKTESTYNVFTYDDEHCCLVQLDGDFCLARPLTRTLIQVNKKCQRLNIDEKTKNYLSKVSRRLNVETSKKLGDKILIELKTKLETNILENDLLCLSAENNNINLGKCYVELSNVKQKKPKRKAKNDTTDENPADENSIHQLEISEPIRIRQGHGLIVQQTYDLNPTDFQKLNRQQRQSWAWFLEYTKKICNQRKKTQKTCIPLNSERVKHLQQLINDKEQFSIPKGSKLFCEDNNERTKFLGYYRRAELCFQGNNRLYTKYEFSDYVSLSDVNKSRDVLEFISNNPKLTNEFEKDCNDEITLAETRKSAEEVEKPTDTPLEKQAESNEGENDESTA